jgi:hypothetical protein
MRSFLKKKEAVSEGFMLTHGEKAKWQGIYPAISLS